MCKVEYILKISQFGAYVRAHASYVVNSVFRMGYVDVNTCYIASLKVTRQD